MLELDVIATTKGLNVTAPITDLTQMELVQQFETLALLARRELSKLTRPGGATGVTIKSLRYKYVADQVFFGFIEVDTQRLPHGVTHHKLVNPEMLRHLTMVLGRSVAKINSTGLTYRVTLLDKRPSQSAVLPAQVELDLAGVPAGELMIPFGVGPEGPVWRPLGEVVGILVGGNPRMGKSTFLNAVLLSLIQTYSAQQLKLALVDPKAVEFTLYQHGQLPHLFAPVAVEREETETVIGRVNLELGQRKETFARLGARNLTAYNRRALAAGWAEVPVVLLVIDEFADVMDDFSGKDERVLKTLKRIIRMGPAFGLHTIIATQRPDALSLDTGIRAILPTRVAFSVSDGTVSKMILGVTLEKGAESIAQARKGRLVVKLPDGQFMHLQGYTVSEQQVAETLSALGQTGSPAASPLTEQEIALIRWTQAGNGGYLTISNLQEWLSLSSYHAGQLIKGWRLRGWLEKDPQNNNAHKVTAEMLRVAGLADKEGLDGNPSVPTENKVIGLGK